MFGRWQRVALALCAAAVLLAAPLPTGAAGECEDHSAGEHWVTGPPQPCAQFRCNADGSIVGTNCATIFAPPSCKLKVVAAGAKFPDCCPEYVC